MTLVLTGATLIDGTGAAPVPDAAVVIDGERIIAAGPRRGLAWPADAQVMDVAGRTLLPGLIDAHDHLASHGYGLATRFGLDEPASTAHMRTARVLAETLAMGYTTVRDARRARLGLQAGRRAGTDPGATPRAGDPDHLADGRHRRSREPVRSRLLLRRLRSPAARSPSPMARTPSATWCAPWSAPAPTSSRRPPPAAPARAPATGPRTRRSRSRRCRRWSPSPMPSAAA